MPLAALVAVGVVSGVGALTFGWLAKSYEAGTNTGRLAAIAARGASIPDTLIQMGDTERFEDTLPGYPLLPDGFKAADGWKAKTDDHLLVSRFDPSAGRFIVAVLSEKDGKEVHRYAPDIGAINKRTPEFYAATGMTQRTNATLRMAHPLLTDDGGIIFQTKTPLIAIDACSRLKWVEDSYLYHHSMEEDADGNYWLPGNALKPTRSEVGPDYEDNYAVQVSRDGKLLQALQLEDIFVRNGLGDHIDGRRYTADPLHLNDIQPVLVDGKYWKKGDIFLSMRNNSMVMLVRPSTGKVLWWRTNPWRFQHDVNVIGDGKISVFDNNVYEGRGPMKVKGSNRIVIYDFATDTADVTSQAAFARHDIRTPRQGRGEILPDGDYFIEETDYGRLLRMGPNGDLRWQYIAARPDKSRVQVGWSRHLPAASFGTVVDKLRGMKCV